VTDAAFADAIRFAFLFGLLTGVPFTMCVQEVVSEFKRWRRHLAAERARLLRCQVTWECLDENGHDGSCVNVKECD